MRTSYATRHAYTDRPTKAAAVGGYWTRSTTLSHIDFRHEESAQMTTTAVGDRLSVVIAGSVVFDANSCPHRLDEFFGADNNRSAVFIFLRVPLRNDLR